MRRLRVAVVGTGSWGQNHVRVYNELPETELIAVCDVNGSKALLIAEVAIKSSSKYRTNKLSRDER